MRLSVVWAAVELRAKLESTLPLDCFAMYSGSDKPVPIPTPDVLIEPDEWADGQPMNIVEWLYASRKDLDLYGNSFGIKTKLDGGGIPKQIHLVAADDVTVRGKGSRVVEYKIGNKTYEPHEIWHERQYTEAGSPIGLSPIAYAARTINTQTAALQFALDWFERGATPSMVAKHTKSEFGDDEADRTKRRLMAAISNGEPAVVDRNWEIQMQSARARDVAFLDLGNYSNLDLARFFGMPANQVDAAVSGQSVTYANLSQDQLRFLIMHFAPSVIRREFALRQLVPGRGFVKLNTEGLLRMDPETRRKLLIEEVQAGLKTVNEARALENLPPLDVTVDSTTSTQGAP